MVWLGFMYGYGISYVVVLLLCIIGLFFVVIGVGLWGGLVVGSVVIYLVYVVGLIFVVGVFVVVVVIVSLVLVDCLW